MNPFLYPAFVSRKYPIYRDVNESPKSLPFYDAAEYAVAVNTEIQVQVTSTIVIYSDVAWGKTLFASPASCDSV